MNTIFLPRFLSVEFKLGDYKEVPISCLRVGLIGNSANNIKYVSIENTPHYSFALNFIHNLNTQKTFEYLSYECYVEAHPSTCSSEQFIDLIHKIKKNGYNSKSNPIMVFRHWSRPFPLKSLDVADGFHRLAILAALGKTKIRVCKLEYKYNIFLRIFRKLYK